MYMHVFLWANKYKEQGFFLHLCRPPVFNDCISRFPSQGERPFSEDEEQKLQTALALEKQALHLVLETSSFLLEQVGFMR